MKHEFVWVDLETTGLLDYSPSGCYGDGKILEWAIILADDGPIGNMTPVVQETGVITYNEQLNLDDYTLKLHTESGLLSSTGLSLKDSENIIIEILRKNYGSELKNLTLAGNTVHFDLQWIRRNMLELTKLIGYRIFDVSTIQRMMESWYPGYKRVKKEIHRALPDILESLENAKQCRELLKFESIGI